AFCGFYKYVPCGCPEGRQPVQCGYRSSRISELTPATAVDKQHIVSPSLVVMFRQSERRVDGDIGCVTRR
ncbi:MAG: hypothetical protein ACKO15_06575, partial [Burkholderiales bacterium]